MNILRQKGLLGILVLALLGVGCSHTHTVHTDTPEEYARISQRSRGQTVVVTLRNGDRRTAQVLHLRPDSSSWYDPKQDAVATVATGEIAEISGVSHRGRGALHGLGFGVLGGAVLGAFAGAATYEPGLFTRGETALLGAIVFGGVGLVLGPPIGAAVGSPTSYRFEPRRHASACSPSPLPPAGRTDCGDCLFASACPDP